LQYNSSYRKINSKLTVYRQCAESLVLQPLERVLKELESYSIDELEQMTGTNRRNISYYIAEGLLPKVGRRGPKTRYGREFVDRLGFIKRAKELQDAGKLPSMTLVDMAELLQQLPAELIAEGAKSNKRLTEVVAENYRGGSSDEFAALKDELMPSADAHTLFEPEPDELPEPAMAYRLSASQRRRRFMERNEAAPDTPRSMSIPTMSAESDDDINEVTGAIRETLNMLKQQTHQQSDAAQELSRLRERTHQEIAELREHTLREMHEMQRMLEDMRQLRSAVGQEIDQLRDTVRELRDLRQSALEDDGNRFRNRPMALERRARMFARRYDLPAKLLRVGQLTRDPLSPKQRAWRFPVDQKMLAMRMTITVLLEGRSYEPKDGEFLVLELPLFEIADCQLLREGNTQYLYLSAEQGSLLAGINCPGLDASEFLRPLATMK
jgi:DNA-binding transcriptional MerR regulator